MEERNCIVCGKPFPATRPNRQSCSSVCAKKHCDKQLMAKDKMARRAILEPPLYSKTELMEAKHNIKLYDTPALAKGREYVLIKAHRIVDYWRKREEMENRVFAFKQSCREKTLRHKKKQKELKNDKRYPGIPQTKTETA